jgi:WD40 repeat protein/uncharacterized caspase-like protein
MSTYKLILLSIGLLLTWTATSQEQDEKIEVLFQKGDATGIMDIVQSPNNKILATTGVDAYVHLRDLKTGIEFKLLKGHTIRVGALFFSADSKYILSKAEDSYFSELICWNITTGEKVYESVSKGRFGSIVLSLDKKYFFYTDYKKGYYLVKKELTTGKEIFRKEMDSNVYRDLGEFILTKDGSKLISTEETGSKLLVNSFDTETGDFIAGFSSRTKGVELVVSSTDSKELIVVTKSYKDFLLLRRFNLLTGETTKLGAITPKEETLNSKRLDVSLIALSPDGKQIAVYNDNQGSYTPSTGKSVRGFLYIYDIASREVISRQHLGQDGEHGELKERATVLEYNNNGKSIFISFGNKKNLTKNHKNTKTILRHYDLVRNGIIRDFESLGRPVDKLIFDPKGKSLLIKSHEHLTQWKFRDLGNFNYAKIEDRVYRFYFSPKGDKLVTDEEHIDWNLQKSFSLSKELKKHTDKYIRSPFHINENYNFLADNSLNLYVFKDQNLRTLNYIGKIDSKFDFHYIDPTARKIVLCKIDDEINTLTYYNIRTMQFDSTVEIANNYNEVCTKYILDENKDELTKDVLVNLVEKWFIRCDLKLPKNCRDVEGQEKPQCISPGISDVAFSIDRKQMALAGMDERLRILDTKTQKVIKILEGHQDKVVKVAYHPKKKILASSSRDGQTILWNTENWERLITISMAGENDYMIYTPEGYYMASKGALKHLAFRKGKKLFTFEQFDLKYNRPDLVMKRLGLVSSLTIKMLNKAYKKRLNRVGFTEEMLGDDVHVPELIVENADEIPTVTDKESLSIDIKAWDEKVTLDRLTVYVNDVPVYGLNGFDIRNQKINELKKELQVELSEGRNSIMLSALNQQGGESLKESFVIEYKPKVKQKNNLYILTVGVSKYKDADRNLTFASKDANDINTLFQKQKEKYNEVIIEHLSDKEVTAATVLKALEKLKTSKVNDKVVLYFSCHGLLDEQLDYYLAMHDVDFNDPAKKGLSYVALEAAIGDIPARQKLVFIDACHSGEVEKDEAVLIKKEVDSDENITVVAKSGNFKVKPKMGLKNSFTYMRTLFADINKGTGTTIISAAGGLEYALESKDWGNGVFTYALLNGIASKEADENEDGNIHVSELQNYIMSSVNKLTNGQQTPTARRVNRLNDFIIFDY